MTFSPSDPFARVADQAPGAADIHGFGLQYRFLRARKTIWAQGMRGLARTFRILQSIGHHPVVPVFFQLVALSLCRPVAKAHGFCFGRAFLLGERLIGLLGVEQLPLQIERGLEPDALIVHLRESLGAVQHRLERAKTGEDLPNHPIPQVVELAADAGRVVPPRRVEGDR